MLRKLIPLTSALVVCLALSGTVRANPYGPVDLGPAASFTVLGISSVLLSQGDVNGNVGIGGGNKSLLKSTVTGNLFIATGATPDIHSQDFFVTGTTFLNANLSSAINAAIAASALASQQVATQTFGSGITTATTISGNGGLNVIAVSGDINLNQANLILSGGASDVFIVNITGDFDLSHAQVLLNGVLAENVLFNMVDSISNGNCVGTPGPETNFFKEDTVFQGTLLAPCRDVEIKDPNSTVFGAIGNGRIIGNNLVIHSGALINGPGQVPEPATIFLLGSGLLGVASLARKRRRH